MKRSLITPSGLTPFSGGASTRGTTSTPKPTVSRDEEIKREIFRRSHLKTFVRYIKEAS